MRGSHEDTKARRGMRMKMRIRGFQSLLISQDSREACTESIFKNLFSSLVRALPTGNILWLSRFARLVSSCENLAVLSGNRVPREGSNPRGLGAVFSNFKLLPSNFNPVHS